VPVDLAVTDAAVAPEVAGAGAGSAAAAETGVAGRVVTGVVVVAGAVVVVVVNAGTEMLGKVTGRSGTVVGRSPSAAASSGFVAMKKPSDAVAATVETCSPNLSRDLRAACLPTIDSPLCRTTAQCFCPRVGLPGRRRHPLSRGFVAKRQQ